MTCNKPITRVTKKDDEMTSDHPVPWFDNQAEEAAKFYMSVFQNSRITTVTRYGDAGPGPRGR